jgi:uncharacterized protein (DUF697 family)
VASVAGIGLGQLLRLVREAQALESPSAHVDVGGVGARELADALAAGGEAGAVTVGGDARRAAASIRLLDGAPSADEVALLRRLTRDARPVIVVRRGTEAVPYVLPDDVLDAGSELPLGEIADAIARVAPDAAPALAARLPVLRAAVERRVIRTASVANAVVAATPWPRNSHLPLLSLAQGRMLLLLGTSRGATLPRDPQGLARAAGPPLAASVGLGLGARELVRRLPVQGPLVRAAVAYGCTRALGTARLRLP